jgi:LacI family transcriptional regulator
MLVNHGKVPYSRRRPGLSAAPPRRQRPTLGDVARLSGVSVSTASRVTNDQSGVDAATRRRVQEAVDRLGYRASKLGRGLVLRRTGTIGLLTPELTNPYFPELVVAVDEECRSRGTTSILGSVDESLPSTEPAVQSLLDHGVDGLLVSGARPEDGYLATIRDSGVPVVLINRPHYAFQTAFVLPDFLAGGRLATRHLLDLGHRRIAYLAGPVGFAPSDLRLRGYLESLAEAGIDYTRVVHLDEFAPEAARVATLAMLRSPNPPTAIAVVNDYCALGSLAAVEDAGLRTPEDVAVLGYDDIWVADLPSIQLSSVSSHTPEMGQRGVRMLLSLIEGDASAAAPILLAPALRVRLTCGGET